MKKLVLACLSSFLTVGTIAAQPLVLDLQKSIEIASESSLEAFRAKNLYQASYWEYRSFRAQRLPSLSLQMTPLQYNHSYTRQFDSETEQFAYFREQSLLSYGTLSLSQNIDLTGGEVFVSSGLDYLRNMGGYAYTQYSSVPVIIGYRQSLIGYNSFKWEKKIEPLKYELAKKQFLYNREQISESVIEHFFTLAMAQAEYKLAVDNVASSDTLFRIGEERQKIAAISQADLMTLKLDAINAKNNLKNAEIELKRAMFSLSSYLNMEKDTEISLVLPDRPRDLLILADQALMHAQENNPDFIGYEQEVLQAEQEVDRTKKSSRFDAELSAVVGFNQVSTHFRDVYRNPSQQEIVTISLNIPLIDWGVRKGKANMAQNNLNVTRISVLQKEQTLEQDVLMTVNDFNIQQDLIASAEEAMELSRMAYNNTKQRYIIGKEDINSLTLSLNRQKEAQKNYLLALKNYWLSYYKIRKLTLYDFEQQLPLTYTFDELLCH